MEHTCIQKKISADITPTTAGNVTARLSQWYNGSDFINPELKDIGRNDRNRFLNILNNDYLYNPRLERYMIKAPENIYNRYNLFIEHLHENTNDDNERREMIGLIKDRNDKLNHRTFKR